MAVERERPPSQFRDVDPLLRWLQLVVEAGDAHRFTLDRASSRCFAVQRRLWRNRVCIAYRSFRLGDFDRGSVLATPRLLCVSVKPAGRQMRCVLAGGSVFDYASVLPVSTDR